MKKERICKMCDKGFEYYDTVHPDRKFCSLNCSHLYFKKNRIGFWNPYVSSKAGRVTQKRHPNQSRDNGRKTQKRHPNQSRDNGRKAAITNKNNNNGFFNSEFQRRMSKRNAKKNPDLARRRGKIGGPIGGPVAAAVNKKNKTGLYDVKIQKMGKDAQKKLKKGFWNSKLQSRLGKRGGYKTALILRKKKELIFNKVHFDSKAEMEIGMCINFQLEKIKEGKNCQVKVGSSSIDFFVNDCFMEYHPWDWHGRSAEEYYKIRREVLNKNGYENSPLIVIK